MRTKPGIHELVTYFCQDMADRLNPSSPGLSDTKKTPTSTACLKAIMRGEYAWLEEGILPLLEK